MVWVYDPQADSWQQASGEHPARPVCVWSRRHSYGWQDLLYMTGGYNGGPFSSVYVYDPQANAWTQLASVSNARYDHASAGPPR